MEPIKVQIELTLSDTAAGALALLAGAIASKGQTEIPAAPAAAPAQEPAPKPRTTRSRKTEQSAAEQAAAPEGPAEPATPEQAAAEPDDMPDFTSPEAEVTDEELLTFIASVKGRKGVQPMKGVFAKYGITCSTACPADQRRALMSDIEALPDNA